MGSQPRLQGIDEDTKERWAERTALADSLLGDGWLANTTRTLDCHRRFAAKAQQRRKHAITHTERTQPLQEQMPGTGGECGGKVNKATIQRANAWTSMLVNHVLQSKNKQVVANRAICAETCLDSCSKMLRFKLLR